MAVTALAEAAVAMVAEMTAVSGSSFFYSSVETDAEAHSLASVLFPRRASLKHEDEGTVAKRLYANPVFPGAGKPRT